MSSNVSSNVSSQCRRYPETLTAASQIDAEPVVKLFGEYVARCLLSKQHWSLRAAALQKVTQETPLQSFPPEDLLNCAAHMLGLAAQVRRC